MVGKKVGVPLYSSVDSVEVSVSTGLAVTSITSMGLSVGDFVGVSVHRSVGLSVATGLPDTSLMSLGPSVGVLVGLSVHRLVGVAVRR